MVSKLEWRFLMFSGVTLTTIICHYIAYSMKKKQYSTRWEGFGILVAILAVVLDILTYLINGISNGILLCVGLLTYMFCQLQAIMENRRKLETERVENENKLLEMQTELMLSQIKPHFLYNTLASISYLCEADPVLAKQTVDEFSDFLRVLFDTVGTQRQHLVSFETAIAHVRSYINVELVRFYDVLHVEYDLAVVDFEIPPLTLQPIVENAIRYGVTKRPDGGTVTISSRETEDDYNVIIADDGVGFDVNQCSDDGRSHVGIENVRRRLQDICHGKLTIESTLGKGTTVIIQIPKKEKEK